jgi:hypothetical protein
MERAEEQPSEFQKHFENTSLCQKIDMDNSAFLIAARPKVFKRVSSVPQF